MQVSAQGRDRAAAETFERMARQRHADEEAGRQRGRRHRRRRIERRRDRRPPPGARTSSSSCKREAPGFANAYIVDIPPQLGIRETRRITGPTNSPPTTCSPARAFPTPSASTAGRSRTMSPATSNGAGRTFRTRAASTTCPTACWCRSRLRQSAGRRPLRLDDA